MLPKRNYEEEIGKWQKSRPDPHLLTSLIYNFLS